MSLVVAYLDIRMRRSHTRSFLRAIRLGDFIAIRVDEASAGFIARLELDLALESLDLFLIQEVAMLISILNALLA